MTAKFDLFCYGTLCFPEIIHSVIGRVPDFVNADLNGFMCYQLHGVSYPAIIPEQQGSVPGVLYTGLGAKELRCIDNYEGREYIRAQVNVLDNQGQMHVAASYLLTPGQYHRLKKQVWLRDEFAKKQLDKYIRRHGWRSRGLLVNRVSKK